jgi:hypothetical protein
MRKPPAKLLVPLAQHRAFWKMTAILGPYSIAFANAVRDGFQGTVKHNVKLDPVPEDIDE